MLCKIGTGQTCVGSHFRWSKCMIQHFGLLNFWASFQTLDQIAIHPKWNGITYWKVDLLFSSFFELPNSFSSSNTVTAPFPAPPCPEIASWKRCYWCRTPVFLRHFWSSGDGHFQNMFPSCSPSLVKHGKLEIQPFVSICRWLSYQEWWCSISMFDYRMVCSCLATAIVVVATIVKKNSRTSHSWERAVCSWLKHTSSTVWWQQHEQTKLKEKPQTLSNTQNPWFWHVIHFSPDSAASYLAFKNAGVVCSSSAETA